MKRLLILGALLVLLTSAKVYAECGYVWVDNKPYWVCDYSQ